MEEERVDALNKIKTSLDVKTIEFQVKTGTHDKVFGKDSSRQLADKLKDMGYNIDKK